jgi:hypothetical protein
MSCCGKNRENLKQSQIRSVTSAVASTVSLGEGTSLVYRGEGSLLVAGPRSRRVYAFSQKTPEGLVETQDVNALLRTGLFLIKR